MPGSWFGIPATAKNVVCGQNAVSNFFGDGMTSKMTSIRLGSFAGSNESRARPCFGDSTLGRLDREFVSMCVGRNGQKPVLQCKGKWS